MITADCFVTMGDVAMMTSPFRLVTGATTPSNRFVAGLANIFATLNGLARWRIDLGVNAGLPARRAIGRAQ
jgi:alkanesulfonate monooxygenase SsuD/methylene tetrahydromethanopterin reductase-like flavin-dependent oxidoreductase (luciferase family)